MTYRSHECRHHALMRAHAQMTLPQRPERHGLTSPERADLASDLRQVNLFWTNGAGRAQMSQAQPGFGRRDGNAGAGPEARQVFKTGG